MLASGNAGRVEGAIPISEIIHHSVRRTSSEAFTRSTRGVFEMCAWWRIFFSCSLSVPFFPLPSLLLFFIYLIKLSTPTVICDSPPFPDIVSRLDSRYPLLPPPSLQPPSKKSTSKYASGLRDSALRSGTIPHNGSDGRTFPRGLFFSPSSTSSLRSHVSLSLTSPFQSHSTLLRFSSWLLSPLNSVP